MTYTAEQETWMRARHVHARARIAREGSCMRVAHERANAPRPRCPSGERAHLWSKVGADVLEELVLLEVRHHRLELTQRLRRSSHRADRRDANREEETVRRQPGAPEARQ